MRNLWRFGWLMAGLVLLGTAALAVQPVGADLLPVFVRAHLGGPIRLAAIGGSITQGGNGWIGPWLRTQFPKSPILVQNAGMSATGSEWANYRLERDVIAYQPNLVFIECAVNDGDKTDEAAIRNVESIIVRLKRLPQPPAIFFVETASRKGGHIARHQRVAAHYGFLDVNLDQASRDYLAQEHLDWKALFNDDVHMNEQGNAFYAKIIAEKLQPFVDAARVQAEKLAKQARPTLPVYRDKLPKPISKKPLLLDARLQTLWPQEGWKLNKPLPYWWDMFFQNVIMPEKPGVAMTIPFRGTTVGVFFAMHEDYGVCFASVDGGEPVEIQSYTRRGYYYKMIAEDLPAGEHVLIIAYPPQDYRPVNLGYLLVAGETQATRAQLAPQGPNTAEALLHWEMRSLPAKAWCWVGPFGDIENAPTQFPTDNLLKTDYPAEKALGGFAAITADAMEANGKAVRWQEVAGDTQWVDFAQLCGLKGRGINYAATRIWVDNAGTRTVRFTVDYYAKFWLNGKLVKLIDTGHGGGRSPMTLSLDLREGWNDILVKVESGSQGNNMSLTMVGDNRSVKFANPLTGKTF